LYQIISHFFDKWPDLYDEYPFNLIKILFPWFNDLMRMKN